ncbi:MAG: rod shape-determining protein MreC [Candidatus Omnitrophica bacterium]|nr:rod shape-determining protein MreC [Candidatus Omnitrophota bacterium]
MFNKIPKQFIYLVVIVAPFWLLFFNSSFWHGLKLKAMGAAASAISVANTPLEELQILLSYRSTYTQYQKLQRENLQLKARAIDFDETLGENVRMETLLGLKARENFTTTAAHVIARDPASWNSSFMIDKGRMQGIKSGMPVINALGVVGKVAEVSRSSSKVILVNDPGFSVAVVNRRSREAGLLSGSLSGECRLSYLSADSDVETGDELVTATLSTSFPEGLLVGTVLEVYAPGGISDARARVKPTIDVARIEEVLVVK